MMKKCIMGEVKFKIDWKVYRYTCFYSFLVITDNLNCVESTFWKYFISNFDDEKQRWIHKLHSKETAKFSHLL